MWVVVWALCGALSPGRIEALADKLVKKKTLRLEGLSCKREGQRYRNSSIAASSASLPGRVIDSGSVASGWSVMLSISRKLGALGLT